jgi:D-alanine transaminase
MGSRVGAWVWLNHRLEPAAEARVGVFDRGFLFGHAAYEVTAVFNRRLVDLDRHLLRLYRTLAALGIPSEGPLAPAPLEQLHRELVEANDLQEGLVYLQVTAGDYGTRDYAGPSVLSSPSVFAYVAHKPLIDTTHRDGIASVWQPDERWARRDLKTTQLLTQALAFRRARQDGAGTAWMHEGEPPLVTEAASANAWIVTREGRLVTRQLSSHLLPGVTRGRVAAWLQADAGSGAVAIEERPFTVAEAEEAQEAFNTSSGGLVVPVLSFNGKPVGTGLPGPITRMVQRLYFAHLGVDLATAAPWCL